MKDIKENYVSISADGYIMTIQDGLKSDSVNKTNFVTIHSKKLKKAIAEAMGFAPWQVQI